jgi:regulatory protein
MDDGNQVPDAEAAGELAPVIPLFGGRPITGADRSGPATLRPERPVESEPSAPRRRTTTSDGWHVTWTDDASSDEVLDEQDAAARAAAEGVLLKKLRTRSLSVREARAVLVEQGLSAELAETVIESLLGHGYLDDLRLAEQLAYIGADRKRQGRMAIAQTLNSRGIPRDVIDTVLADSDDDDAQRALEFARYKARSLRTLDREVALRRLVGQLARRGYGGGLALSAARAALDESGPPNRASTVRFE